MYVDLLMPLFMCRSHPVDNAGFLLQNLWEEEVVKKGLEKASLVNAALRFQRTRLILSVLIGTFAMAAAFVGPNIMLVQNPEPYLEQKKDNHTAVKVINATLSWTRAVSDPDLPTSQNSQVKEHKEEENVQSESPPTLRNISFTLPKVCCKSDGLFAVLQTQLKGN
ncbi:hypothetical protein XENOCAPTIV_015849 [Xenoophorus captivus]|uniref:Uncharacterized protein n=1 Tax=Xenoophorus captivus TaxID=1517983 RepID=A0ABV0R3T2_9TELE